MTSSDDTFSNPDFVNKFEERRLATDSVNTRLDEPALHELLPELDGTRVLDIGCGFGKLAYDLSNMGATVVGLDTSPLMIQKAKISYTKCGLDFRVGTIDTIADPSSFDAVVSALVVHFIENFDSFLFQANRVLKLDGCLIFSQRHPIRTADPSFSNGENRDYWQVKNYFDESKKEFNWLGYKTHVFHRTFSSIIGSVLSAGFHIVDVVEPKPSGAISGSGRMKESLSVPSILTIKCQKVSDLS